jgi:replicative DNA helicase
VNDRLPPHSVEAEQGVLGCILLDPAAALNECEARLAGLPGSPFYELRHQAIYNAARALHDNFKPVDILTLGEALKATGDLDKIGGLSYLSPLADGVPSAANLPAYLDVLVDKARRRQIIRAMTHGVAGAFADAPLTDIIGPVQDELDAALTGGVAQAERRIKQILPGVIDDLEKYHRGKTQLAGLPTGFAYLDNVFQGIGESHYVVIAGRPGDGKSSLAMNIVEYVARDHVWWRPTGEKHEDGKPVMESHRGLPVCVFSLEMDGESLVKRMLFGMARADMGMWNTGMATTSDMQKLATAAQPLASMPVWIDDVSDQTIGQIRSKARRMVKEHGIKLFVLDYVQLLDVDDEKLRGDRVRELTKISKAIVSLKKQLKVPWLVLAQMNRNIEQAEAKRVPILSDLKDCGALEQDADKVALLYRPSLKEREENEQLVKERFALRDAHGNIRRDSEGEPLTDWSKTPSLVNAFVAKNRQGPCGPVEFLFHKNQTRFEDLGKWKASLGAGNDKLRDGGPMTTESK